MSQTGPFNSQNRQSYSIFKKKLDLLNIFWFLQLEVSTKEVLFLMVLHELGENMISNAQPGKFATPRYMGLMDICTHKKRYKGGLQVSTGYRKNVSFLWYSLISDTFFLHSVLNCSSRNFSCVCSCPTNPPWRCKFSWLCIADLIFTQLMQSHEKWDFLCTHFQLKKSENMESAQNFSKME